jgi:glycine/D-amino acid oxidase-like deaminating enzyme/nitrite reductase/ring-hydroxylating ferredoxin subunit
MLCCTSWRKACLPWFKGRTEGSKGQNEAMPRVSKETDTTPFWTGSASLPRFQKLDRSARVDVAIVGAGITGLTAAYLLSSEGHTVAVIERDRCAGVDSGHTTAHLTMVTDDRLTNLVASFGQDHAQAVWDAGLAAIAQIDAIVRDEQIACGFTWVPGYLHAPVDGTDDESQTLQKEAALASSLGFDATFVADVPVMQRPGVRFDNQARFHPTAYLAGLARAIVDKGGLIFEQTPAEGFSDDPPVVHAGGHTIRCDHIVLATHNPLTGTAGFASAALLQTKLALYSSYVVAGRIRKDRVPDALFWDTANPYCYLRLERADHDDLVILGGEDHKTGQVRDTTTCYERLERTLSSLVPDVDMTHRWSGQVIETADGLPYFGETSRNQFVATGFSGNGMTFGTLGAMIMADRILGRPNPWSELFDADRTRIRAGLWDYIEENSDYPYYMIRDRFAGAEGRSLRDVPRGQGKVLQLDGQRVAAYRGEDGAMVLRSAVCTHMGCLVDWNEAERTWDCPCHGSRFRPTGEVLAGPAESALSEVAERK